MSREELEVDGLRLWFASGEACTLLDVREPFERDLARIAGHDGAVDAFIPMGDVPDAEDWLRAAAARTPLVVYCHHGVRSLHVVHWLASRGIEAVSLRGGIDAWSTQVDPSVPRY